MHGAGQTCVKKNVFLDACIQSRADPRHEQAAHHRDEHGPKLHPVRQPLGLKVKDGGVLPQRGAEGVCKGEWDSREQVA